MHFKNFNIYILINFVQVISLIFLLIHLIIFHIDILSNDMFIQLSSYFNPITNITMI